jgi:hypothetical protein
MQAKKTSSAKCNIDPTHIRLRTLPTDANRIENVIVPRDPKSQETPAGARYRFQRATARPLVADLCLTYLCSPALNKLIMVMQMETKNNRRHAF